MMTHQVNTWSRYALFREKTRPGGDSLEEWGEQRGGAQNFGANCEKKDAPEVAAVSNIMTSSDYLKLSGKVRTSPQK